MHDASGAWLADVNSRHADEICKALNEAEALSKVAQCASELRGKIPDIDCIIGMRELIESIAALQSLRAESKSE